MDGKFDITGKNQTGDGELTGPTVQFDMDPNRQSWRHNSPGHRPGTYHNGRNNSKVPAIPNGYAVYDTGKREALARRGFGKKTPEKATEQRSSTPSRSGLASGSKTAGAPMVRWADTTGLPLIKRKRPNG